MKFEIKHNKTCLHHTGTVIAVYGRNCLIETSDKTVLECVTRGKKSGIVCGDQVEVLSTTPGQGVIEKIKPRNTLLYRSNSYRKKVIAANITQIIIVVAAIPSFSEELINRCLVAAENQSVKAIIVLNKADLTEPTKQAASVLSYYETIGYPLVLLSAQYEIAELIPYLKNQLSVLSGQSGMGKSTLINKLIPGAKRATAQLSQALNSGCHTTTHSHLYHIDDNSHIIDTPGIQEFGIHHIEENDLVWGFVEFRPYIGQCKFNNCRHSYEPDCAIINAVRKGKISEQRLFFYRKLSSSLSSA